MNVKVENLPHSQSLVTVEVEPERMTQAKEEAFRRIAREVSIPGFRKGKAPRNLVERYVRPEAVEEDAETHLMDEIWTELRADQFKETSLFDAPQVKVAQHTPLVFEITLTHAPSVQLGDYKNVRLAPELTVVSEEDVNETIERLRAEQAQWQPVQHRPLRQGDMATIQAHGLLDDQPIVVPDGFSVTIDAETTWLTPGFVLRMIDMDVDVEKEFQIQVPEDATDKALAGKSGTAYVTVKEIKEKITPDLDDSLAKTLGADSIADLTEKVRLSLVNSREESAHNRLENNILDEVAKLSTISFPETMVDQQVTGMITDRTEYLRRRGLDMNLYLQITKMTMDEMRAEIRPEAEKRIRNFLLIEELGHAEGIVVEDSVVHAEIDRVAASQTDPAAARRELSTNDMHERIKNNLYIKQLFDRLIAIVTEGQTPVMTASALPSPTDSIVAEDAEPKAEAEAGEEKPKLIIATH